MESTHGADQPVVATDDPVFSHADSGTSLGPAVIASALSRDSDDYEQPVVSIDDEISLEEDRVDEQPVVSIDDEISLEEDRVDDEPEQQTAARPDQATTEVEKVYSSSEVARIFFRKSLQWLYWGQKNGVFTYPDGSPIEPIKIGKAERRRYTLPIIKEMALAQFRRGNLKEQGYWEASAVKNGTKYVVRSESKEEAVKEFRRKRGYPPKKVEWVDGLRDILERIKRAETDVIEV